MPKIRSLIWNHYNKLSISQAQCGVCLAILSYKGGSTTNLLRHFQKKHPNHDRFKRKAQIPGCPSPDKIDDLKEEYNEADQQMIIINPDNSENIDIKENPACSDPISTLGLSSAVEPSRKSQRSRSKNYEISSRKNIGLSGNNTKSYQYSDLLEFLKNNEKNRKGINDNDIEFVLQDDTDENEDAVEKESYNFLVESDQSPSSKTIKHTRLHTHAHPVDAFLAGIAPTLKSLSSYQLNLAKSKIFATVQEFELAMLQEGSQGEG